MSKFLIPPNAREPSFALRRLAAALFLILAVEAVVFSASLGKYFCGDSLYFFSHSISSAQQAIESEIGVRGHHK